MWVTYKEDIFKTTGSGNENPSNNNKDGMTQKWADKARTLGVTNSERD